MLSQLTAAVQPQATRRLIKKNTILLYQGEVPRGAYVVSKGIVKAYNLTGNGEEQITAFIADNEPFPSPWIFDKSSGALFYYETMTDCEIYTLAKDDLLAIIAGDVDLQKSILNYFVTSYTGSLLRITALEQSRASEKILYTLYYLLFRYGKETSPGSYVVNLELTHTIIAKLIGLTRETTANELGKVRKKGVITYDKQYYTIDKAKLERLIGEDSFADLTLQ